MDDLKPYPAYKDSGVPWLGDVPKHWDVQRQRNVVQMFVSNVDKHTLDGELPVRLCNYTDVYKNERITEKIAFMRASATQDEVDRFRLKTDDVIITKDSELWTDISVPALVEYTAPDLVCGYHLAVLRPYKNVILGAYLLRATQSQGVATQYHVAANGVTRYGLSHIAIKNIIVPLPPLAEQTDIIKYLDYVDRRVRRYIRAKQKLIKLLEEQKQAIIHQAVTRGLDPDVPLKDAGIDWLGDIPTHWGLISLKHLLTQMDYGTSQSLTKEGGIRVLTMGHIKDGEITLPEQGNLEAIPTNLILEQHDLLFNRTNSPALVGKVGIFRGTASDNVSFASYLVRLRAKPEHNPFWLNYLLNSTRFWAYARSQALISLHQANLNSTRYGQMLLPVPSESEQLDIVEYIIQKTATIQHTIITTYSEISLLREYRTRLIADVVTGKLDVRAAAEKLKGEGGSEKGEEEEEVEVEEELMEMVEDE